MVGDARRHVDAAPAGGPRAPGDVRVLAEREEARVEAADRVEHRATVEGDARRCAEHLLDRAAVDGRCSREPVEGDPQPVDDEPGGVDRVAARVEADLAAGGADLGRPGRAQQRDGRARLELGVVVDEQDPFARRRLEAGDDAAREAEVAALREDARALGPADPARALRCCCRRRGARRRAGPRPRAATRRQASSSGPPRCVTTMADTRVTPGTPPPPARATPRATAAARSRRTTRRWTPAAPARPRARA